MSSDSPDLPQAIVAEARSWIGTPYRHQASLKGVGCDCLGLLRGVWRGVLGPEPEAAPPYAASWTEAGADALVEAARRHLVALAAGAEPLPGDVLLFAFRAGLPARHCALVTGPGRMIHAHDGAAVSEVALTPWWRRHLAHVFRFPTRALSDEVVTGSSSESAVEQELRAVFDCNAIGHGSKPRGGAPV